MYMQCIPLRVHDPPFPRQTEAVVVIPFVMMQKDQYMDPPMPYNFCIFAILLNFE